MSEQSSAPAAAELPVSVRSRLVTLCARVLPEVPRLPPSLRKVASFTPARRARLGGSAITAALDADDELRARTATQVAAMLPDDDAGELAMVGARAWLLRPDGWQATLEDCLGRLGERERDLPREDDRVPRLTEQLHRAEQALREQRVAHRAEMEEHKSQNATLRRKLGESRTAERAAHATAAEASASVQGARADAELQVAAQDKELRRLRAQVAAYDAAAAGERSAARSERDEATVRARLLLDTIVESATGLRRELALPPVKGAPGDRVEAGLISTGTRASTSAGSLGASSAALLQQQLAMPRARLIVDGYNVTKSGWPSSSLEAQRIRLLNALAPLVAWLGAETTVVFDAAHSSARPVVSPPRGVKVVFSPEGVIADDVIRNLVAVEPEGRVVVVVTDDREIVTDVTRVHARAASSAALLELLTRSG